MRPMKMTAQWRRSFTQVLEGLKRLSRWKERQEEIVILPGGILRGYTGIVEAENA